MPGSYPGGIWLKGLHGRPDAPITIRGKGPQTVLLGKAGTNTIDLTDCQWLVIRDLTFDGQGKQVDAIKAGKDASAAATTSPSRTTRSSTTAPISRSSASRRRRPCSDWTIRGNTILGAGTGLYLGNSDGNQPFVRGMIEYNLVSDPVGYCMQIKHQNPRPDIAGLPSEPSTTIIRYNVFVKGDRPSPDGNRPNLLLGGLPDDGPGAQDRYQVYGNVLFHNPRESLVQATGRVSFHDNVFADVPGTAILITPHAGKSPKQVFIYHNTFVQVGRGHLRFARAAGRVRGRRQPGLRRTERLASLAGRKRASDRGRGEQVADRARCRTGQARRAAPRPSPRASPPRPLSYCARTPTSIATSGAIRARTSTRPARACRPTSRGRSNRSPARRWPRVQSRKAKLDAHAGGACDASCFRIRSYAYRENKR